MGDLDAFFTDRMPPADICELLAKNDVRLHVAGVESQATRRQGAG
jgi:hypothetical protein